MSNIYTPPKKSDMDYKKLNRINIMKYYISEFNGGFGDDSAKIITSECAFKLENDEITIRSDVYPLDYVVNVEKPGIKYYCYYAVADLCCDFSSDSDESSMIRCRNNYLLCFLGYTHEDKLVFCIVELRDKLLHWHEIITNHSSGGYPEIKIGNGFIILTIMYQENRGVSCYDYVISPYLNTLLGAKSTNSPMHMVDLETDVPIKSASKI